MNAVDEDRLARRIARRLDLGGVTDAQGHRLASARAKALARAAGERWRWLPARGMVPLLGAAVAVMLVTALLLHQELLPPVESPPPSDVDYALLVDDLPIDAYLDEGFMQWLAQRSES